MIGGGSDKLNTKNDLVASCSLSNEKNFKPHNDRWGRL